MRKIFAIIKKNVKIITRTKSSALIIILGPLLLIMLIGAAFNTANVYGVRIGTYSGSYSTLSNSLIDELGKKRFTVQKIESQEACIDGIKRGIIHVCAIFPPDISIKGGGDILFYVDNSRLNLVYMVLDALSTVIGTKTKEISAQLTQNILDTVDQVDKELQDKSTLLASLETDNADMSSRLSRAVVHLQNLDLSFTPDAPGLDTLEKIAKKNTTESEDITTAIELIKKELQTADKKFKEAVGAKDQVLQAATNIKAALASDLKYIQTIDASMDKITAEIKKVKTTSVSKIVSPLSTKIEPVSAEKTQLNYIFPTLMVLVVMFVSLMLASMLEIREKTNRVYLKNFITPTSSITFLVSNFITNILVIVIQLAIIFGVAWYFFREQLVVSLGGMAIILALITTFFILLGMIIGTLFKSEETGTIATISLGFIFLFFSSSILPIETLPSIIQKITAYNPFFIGESLLNKVLLFQLPITLFTQALYILAGYIGGLMIILLIMKKLTKRSF